MTNIFPQAGARFSMLAKTVSKVPGLPTSKIKPYQVALVDADTYLTVADASNSKSVFVVVGSPNKGIETNPIVGLGDINSYKQSYKSQIFKSVEDDTFYTLSPEKQVAFVGYYGWDGVNDCKSPNFECGKNYGVQVRVSGTIIEQLYGTYEIYQDFYADTPCCDPCDDSCTLEVGCKSVFESWVSQMNDLRDGANPIGFFGKFSLVSDCNTVTPAATTTDWCLEVCDTGDQDALNEVKAQYPDFEIERTDRKKSISKYSVCLVDPLEPAPFLPTNSVELAACDGTCPTGFTAVPKSVIYNIERPLAGTEDLTTDATKQAFADLVGGAYGSIKSTFLNSSSASAIITIQVPVGTAVTVLLADKLIFVQETPALCVPAPETAISWTACGTGYKTKRTQCITVKLDDCVDSATSAANILADIQLVMETDPTVIKNSVSLVKSGKCMAIYSVDQLSEGCAKDGCDTIATPEFKRLKSYKGLIWDTCPCIEVTPDATNCKCGIKVEGFLPECQPDGCYVDLNKYKNYELPKFDIRPIDPVLGKCNENSVTEFITTQDPTYETLDGVRVLKEVLAFRRGYLNENHISAGFSTPTQLIDALGLETASGIDQCANYHVVHALVNYSTKGHVSDATEQLQDIQLFFEDITVRDSWIQLLSTFTLKPQIGVPVKYLK